MDLKAKKKELADKEAIHRRIAAQLEALKAELAVASHAARDAQAKARELSIAAVIDPKKRAEAEAAGAALAELFEKETILRDRFPILDNAAGRVYAEIPPLRAEIARAERELITAAVRDLKAGAIERLIQASAELLTVRNQGEAPSMLPDLGPFFEEYMSTATLVERAAQVRADIRRRVIEEVQP